MDVRFNISSAVIRTKYDAVTSQRHISVRTSITPAGFHAGDDPNATARPRIRVSDLKQAAKLWRLLQTFLDGKVRAGIVYQPLFNKPATLPQRSAMPRSHSGSSDADFLQ